MASDEQRGVAGRALAESLLRAETRADIEDLIARELPAAVGVARAHLAPAGTDGGMPLIARGRPLGTLVLDGEATPALGALAAQVALALDRADLLARDQAVVRFSDEQLGVFAHDLRSPLGAIALTADTLLATSADPAARKRFELIQRGTRRMERMLKQLVDYARARLGTGLRVTASGADLAALAREAAAETRARTGRAIEVEAEGDAQGPWDGDRLAVAVAHLIDNAVDHGPADATVQVRLDGTDPARVRLSVWNPGAIDPGLVPQLFEPFRGGRPRTKTSGLGLGLHLTRIIAELHRGAIDVETGATGTTFTLALPRA